MTVTGEQCAKWSTFSSWLQIRMHAAKKNIEKLKGEKGIFSHPSEDSMDQAIINGANLTRKGMEEKGEITKKIIINFILRGKNIKFFCL